MADRAFRWLPLLLVVLLLLRVTREAATPLNDPDVWWHLRLGNDFLRQKSLGTPAWSTFSDRSWVPTQPLSEVVMAVFQRCFGLAGVAWLFGCALMGVVISFFFAARACGDRLAASVATVVAMMGCSVALSPRPQLISLILLPVVVTAWLRSSADGLPRWWLIPLIGVWSFAHGFWFVGAGVSAVSAIAISIHLRVDRRTAAQLLAVPAASVALVAVRPSGPAVLAAPFHVNATAHFISEWRPTEWHSLAAMAVVAMTLVVSGAWVVLRTRPSALDVSMLLMAILLLGYSQRTVALSSALLTPLVAGALQGLVDRSRDAPGPAPRPSRGERLLLLSASALFAALLAAVVPTTAARPGDVPTGLDSGLDALPESTRVLDWYDIGGWLAWQHPELQRYVDGLTDAYSAAHLLRYASLVEAGPGWHRQLRAADLQAAVLPVGNVLAKALKASGWTVVASDAGYALLVSPEHGGFAATS
jgi:hypothetical protein